MIESCVPKSNQKLVRELIINEEFHYIEPQHKSIFIDKMWDVGQAIYEHRYLNIRYTRLKDKSSVNRIIKPVAIMFSEYYFYMVAYIDDEETRKDFAV